MNMHPNHSDSIGIPGRVSRFFRQKPIASLASFVLLLLLILSICGSSLAPHDPLKADISLRLAPPSFQYPLGNDALGRCLFSRMLCGTRMSIGMGMAVVLFSSVFGCLIGLISGYAGKLTDEILMRLTDIFLSFPEIIAAMAVAGLMGPGTLNLLFALSFVGWMRYARTVRGITLSVKEREYVKYAKLSGVSGPVILFRHILPPNMASLTVLATIGMAKSILAVSALGFLGFGVQPPDTEWGTLLMEGKDYILSAPHLSLYPGIAIMLSVLSFHLLGDALRDMCSG